MDGCFYVGILHKGNVYKLPLPNIHNQGGWVCFGINHPWLDDEINELVQKFWSETFKFRVAPDFFPNIGGKSLIEFLDEWAENDNFLIEKFCVPENKLTIN